MPETRPLNPPASRLFEPSLQSLAFCTVGAGYSQPVSPGHRQPKVCFGSY